MTTKKWAEKPEDKVKSTKYQRIKKKGITKMKDKTFKNIRICCYAALAFCVVWAGLMVNYLIIELIVDGILPHPVDWSQNAVVKASTLACYVLGTLAMIALTVMVVINILKGLRENTVFPRSNEKLLFWIALADFVYLLGFTNLHVLWNENLVFQLQHTNFVTPFFLLFFAFMYKVAADAVEENNLTV